MVPQRMKTNPLALSTLLTTLTTVLLNHLHPVNLHQIVQDLLKEFQ